MTKTVLKPKKARRLTPMLVVPDVRASLSLYASAFGFKIDKHELITDAGGTIQHAGMRYKGKSLIMLAPEGAPGSLGKSPRSTGQPSPIELYVYCDDVDRLFARAVAAGVQPMVAPEDAFWGDRIARVQDADGYTWTFATRVGECDPSKIPAAPAETSNVPAAESTEPAIPGGAAEPSATPA